MLNTLPKNGLMYTLDADLDQEVLAVVTNDPAYGTANVYFTEINLPKGTWQRRRMLVMDFQNKYSLASDEEMSQW